MSSAAARAKEEVFETPDPEPFENASKVPEAECEDVDTARLSAGDSYKVFSAHMNPLGPRPDMSGSVESYERLKAHNRPRGKKETPLQRLERIKLEAAELQHFFLGEQAKAGIAASAYPESVTDELKGLQMQLGGISTAMGDTAAVADAMSSGHSVAGKLLKDLETHKASETPAAAKGKAAAATAGVTYELYVDGGAAGGGAGVDVAKVAALERRLAELEKATGTNRVDDHGERTLPKDMVGFMSELWDKVAMLTPERLSMLEKQASTASQKLEDLSAKASAIKAQELKAAGPPMQDFTPEQIAQVLQFVDKASPMAEELPMLVARMYSLKGIHEEAAKFTANCKQIVSEQTESTTTLKEQSALLKAVESNMADNMKTMASNMEKLEKRFKEVQDKMSKIKK